MRQTLKDVHDALLRTGLCMVWLTGAVLMVTNVIAYESEPYGENATLFAVRALICAVVTIAGITAHAYLMEKKVKEDING